MQKIKLTIANRVYPLNVPLEQEEGLRVASKKIDIMIKHFEENYAGPFITTSNDIFGIFLVAYFRDYIFIFFLNSICDLFF